MTRWRQGDINLVVNREKEGFAHSFNIVHGSAVCALGPRRRRRGGHLRACARCCSTQPFRQAVGPGELDIPAVRGVGGSLVYFLDPTSELGRVWDIEFDDTGEPAGNDAGLTTVDHISQSMQYEEMLTWLLFYTSLLDLKKIAPQDVARSRRAGAAARWSSRPTAALRIVLNASQSQRTAIVALPHASCSAPACSTSPSPPTTSWRPWRGWRQTACALLPIPENYYDDLEAKTDLPADQLDALKAHNILYDREGDAEYLQVYTETFDQRFFFEIVQRRGYRGYGAANAPVRLGRAGPPVSGWQRARRLIRPSLR
mgnify:CR=1 FL=1